MEETALASIICKRQTRLYGVILLIITVFYAVVCTPISIIVTSDVLMADTVLPMLVDFVLWVANYSVYWVSFAFLLYITYAYGAPKTKHILWIYLAATVFRYTANMIAGFIVIGFPTGNEFLGNYLPYYIFDILLDLLQMTVAVLVLRAIKKRNTANSTFLPIEKLFDRKNAVSRSAFWIAVIPAALQLLSRLRYDIAFGAPQNVVDLFWMIFSYASDIVGFAVGYMIIVLLINQLFLQTKRSELVFQSEQNRMINEKEDTLC